MEKYAKDKFHKLNLVVVKLVSIFIYLYFTNWDFLLQGRVQFVFGLQACLIHKNDSQTFFQVLPFLESNSAKAQCCKCHKKLT